MDSFIKAIVNAEYISKYINSIKSKVLPRRLNISNVSMGFLYKPVCKFDEKFSYASDFHFHLKANGCWPTDGDVDSLWYQVLDKLYTIWNWFVMFCLAFAMYAEGMYLLANITDLQKAVGNLCLLMIGVMVGSRMLHVRYAMQRLKELLKFFADKIWIKKESHPLIYERCIKRTKTTFYISLTLWFCLVIYVSMPIVILLTTDQTMASDDKYLPFFTIFPYDQQEYWNYIYTYIFCIYAGYIVVSQFYAMDAVLAYFISFVCGKFEILHGDIVRLIPECHAEWLRRYRDDIAGGEGGKLRYLHELYKKRLHELAARHKDVILFCMELEDFVSFPIFVNFGTSAFLICFVGFQFMVTGRSSFGDFMRFLMFFLAVTGQLYVVCDLGSILITLSTETTRYLYNCNWEGGGLSENSPLLQEPEAVDVESLSDKLPSWQSINYYPANRDFKLKLLFMIMRSHRPIQLTALKFTVLSLESFNSVLSTSLSYFALLNSFMDK